MKVTVSRFFILNGRHYNTGDVLDEKDPALSSGLSHCLRIEKSREDSAPKAAPPPLPAKPKEVIPEEKSTTPLKKK